MYEIEVINKRYIVWRHKGGNKFRQGSFATEGEALARIYESRELLKQSA
jgi:hypothetical protein